MLPCRSDNRILKRNQGRPVRLTITRARELTARTQVVKPPRALTGKSRRVHPLADQGHETARNNVLLLIFVNFSFSSNRILARFASPYPYNMFKVNHEYLAVSDLAGTG